MSSKQHKKLHKNGGFKHYGIHERKYLKPLNQYAIICILVDNKVSLK